jgi:DNA-binding MarR family transcriptional regulator
MIEDLLLDITGKVNLQFYRRIFSVVKEREGSLTAMEVFSLEVIHAMNEPTISEFAEFIGISRPGASYKVASLMQKGYVTKEVSAEDKREFRLRLTDKYRDYFGLYENGLKESVRDKLDTLSDREKKHLEQFLTQLSRNLDEE